MTLMNDWRFWLFTVSILKDFILVLGIVLVKFNDLRHLSKDSETIKNSLEKINKRLGKIEKTQVAITTRCSERHKK